jgi:hypothetical protein
MLNLFLNFFKSLINSNDPELDPEPDPEFRIFFKDPDPGGKLIGSNPLDPNPSPQHC